MANSKQAEKSKPLFRDLTGDTGDSDVTEIESLCMRCHEKGATRLMLTKIPYFKEVVVSSFSCLHCGETNSSLQSAGEIQIKGVKLTVTVSTVEDLNRQVVKSEYCAFDIPHLEFECPSNKQSKGEINTVEGLVQKIIDGLSLLQPHRRHANPTLAGQLDVFIQELRELKEVREPFVIVLTDASGNSFIENIHAPKKDPGVKIEHFERSAEENKMVGLDGIVPLPDSDDEEKEEEKKVEEKAEEEADEGGVGEGGDSGQTFDEAALGKLDLNKEVLEFPYTCPQCSTPGVTRMKIIDIPYFKEVVLMATSCDQCGYRDNEVKGGAGIEPQGTLITLHVTNMEDLARDILKSDHCAVEIPLLDMELGRGTLGGKFTTVEGLLSDIKEQLSSSTSLGLGVQGDGSDQKKRVIMEQLLEKLGKMIRGEILDYNLILDDPSGNSYVQNCNAPDADPELSIEKYDRTDEQKDSMGLLQMKTEDY